MSEDPRAGSCPDGRPEGRRTYPRKTSRGAAAWQSVAVFVVWVIATYAYRSAPFGIAVGALRAAFGIVAVLVLCWAVEGAAIRRDWRLPVGALFVAAWLAVLAIAPRATRWWVVLGLVGFALPSTIAPRGIAMSNLRERDFMLAHPRYARLRRLLVRGAEWLAVALLVIGAVSSLIGVLFPGARG